MIKRDFSALEAKLARGKPLSLAAEEAGIPLEEASAYLDKRRHADDQASADQLALFADEALATALEALKAAIIEKNRTVLNVEKTGEGGSRYHGLTQTKEQVLDVDAAKALLRAGLDARRMLERRKAPYNPYKTAAAAQQVIQDLFDLGPWKVKKSDP